MIQNRANSKIVLQAKGLTKVYQTSAGDVEALVGVDLEFGRGEFVAIVGPSGSGKSTLLNLLGVLEEPTGGQILIEGLEVSSLSNSERALIRNELIGFIFQSYNLIQRTTVLKNVTLPGIISNCSRKALRSRAFKLLDIMGIRDKAYFRPMQLSGGQQQRVAIARALVNDPPIILADEPTGNLDSQTGNDVFELLRNLARTLDRTIVMVTHNLALAEHADRAIHIRDGRVEREVWN
jgi:putative ABC transport system ATP-binding protein